jgi:hypothetical protein
LAITQRILLVSFAPSHRKHNDRLTKLLQSSFLITHLDLVSEPGNAVSVSWLRTTSIKFANYFSLGLISMIIVVLQLINLKFGRRHSTDILSRLIEIFFSGKKGVTTQILRLNQTLRIQKYRYDLSKQVLTSAVVSQSTCVLFPEDNNYYATGLIFPLLHEKNIDVGVVEFTTGKKAEFEGSQKFFSSDMKTLKYSIFSKMFLSSSALLRWRECSEYMNYFPGSLETSSHSFLNSSVQSGLANFYLSTSKVDLEYLAEIVDPKTLLTLIKPIEVSSTIKRQNNSSRTIFAVFLPPNQTTDQIVKARLLKKNTVSYTQLINEIVTESVQIRDVADEIVFFPHPRIYLSDSSLIEELSRNFRVEPDFDSLLGEIRYALIFSSAVFASLLAANIRVFNLDVYGYNYEGVFPKDNEDFVEISSVADISQFTRDFSYQSLDLSSDLISATEFLESRLLT